MDTTLDAFLGGALTLQQPATGYRAGLDAVLLAAAVPIGVDERVRCLDCGAGVGTAGLCLARRAQVAEVTLVEKEPALAGLAKANAAANDLDARVRVVVADLTQPLGRLGPLADAAGSFDHVLANPPYHDAHAGTRATDPHKAASHAMGPDDLDAWVRFAAAMARSGGTLTLIHRTAALGTILAALGGRFGHVRLLPLHPRPGEPASRVLVQAIKGSRAPLLLLAGRVLHRDGEHGFTDAFDGVLRHGQAIAWE